MHKGGLLARGPIAHTNSKRIFIECEIFEEPKLMEPDKFKEWKRFSVNNLPENLIDKADIEFVNRITSPPLPSRFDNPRRTSPRSR